MLLAAPEVCQKFNDNTGLDLLSNAADIQVGDLVDALEGTGPKVWESAEAAATRLVRYVRARMR